MAEQKGDVRMGYQIKYIFDEIYQEHLVLREEARSEKIKDSISEYDRSLFYYYEMDY